MKRRLTVAHGLLALLAAVCATLPEESRAAPAPYSVDSHTLHLWHLDEPHTPAHNAVPGARKMLSLHNGAVLGAPGFPGFKSCLRIPKEMGPPANIALFHGGILLAAQRLAADTSDNVTNPFPYFGTDGAFTMEALVKLDVMPENLPTHAAMILSMDDDDINVRRIFHFRIEKSGHLSFSPLPGSGARGGAYARIPTEGPHRLQVDTWFHAVVTYDGNAGTTDNMRLFWTRLESGVTEANPIGTGTLTDDLNGDLGDFAIANEARQFRGNGESEPFAGCIDEVRISSIARDPADLLFGNQPGRPREVAASASSNDVTIRLDSVKIDGVPRDPEKAQDGILVLPPGQHRIDIGFRHLTGPASGPLKVTYQLTGADEGWKESNRGMQVTCQFLDESSQVISQSAFPVTGTSPGWEGSISDSTLLPCRESLMVPRGAGFLRIRVSSGTPDTTGTLVLDDLQVRPTIDGGSEAAANLWPNSGFSQGRETASTSGVPDGWERGGDPSISRLAIASGSPSLALVDGDAGGFGEWVATVPLPPEIKAGRTLVISWLEVFNIIEGQQHLASYIKVPPGDYTFQTTAIALNGTPTGSSASLRIRIPQPLVQRPWFAPALVGGLVALVSSLILMAIRQRNQSKVERLRLQTELERDRTRIARDMHDDLGTVATAITMTASLANRNLCSNPAKAAEHLQTVGQSARKLVGALDDLVWAVDPANDTLDELGVHLTRLVEDLFTDSGIRHRIRIPGILPQTHLGSETRHHLALAVKEALHNVLQHSSANEVVLSMDLLPDAIRIEVKDDGKGFVFSRGNGNGLPNMTKRLADIGGTCRIESAPQHGTLVRLQLPLALPHPEPASTLAT
jgi:signal transduction histidine kinase